MRVRTPLALVVAMFTCALGTNASARPEVVTWAHESPCDLDGFELRIGPSQNQITRVIEIDQPRQAGSHFSYPLEGDEELADSESVYICVAARRNGVTGQCSNQLNLAPDAIGTTRSLPAPGWQNRRWCEDFGGQPRSGWVDTGPGSSLEPVPGLFNVQPSPDLFERIGTGNFALTTANEDPDVHSHFLAADSEGIQAQLWSAYEYSGQLRYADDQASIGVTFYSLFDSSARYYRLGRRGGGDFTLTRDHLDPSFRCDPGSAAPPTAPHTWLAFRVRIQDEGQHTTLESKVWPANQREPEGFQTICTDSNSARPPSGAIGVWSGGAGQKWWDNLSVSALESESGADPIGIAGKPAPR